MYLNFNFYINCAKEELGAFVNYPYKPLGRFVSNFYDSRGHAFSTSIRNSRLATFICAPHANVTYMFDTLYAVNHRALQRNQKCSCPWLDPDDKLDKQSLYMRKALKAFGQSDIKNIVNLCRF